MAGVRVDVIQSSIKNSEEVLESEILNKWDQYSDEIGEIFIEICTPFVPYKTGRLINSGHVVSSSKEGIFVNWNAVDRGYDYARRQYSTPYYHPIQGTDHWDQEAMALEGDTFVSMIERLMNK